MNKKEEEREHKHTGAVMEIGTRPNARHRQISTDRLYLSLDPDHKITLFRCLMRYALMRSLPSRRDDVRYLRRVLGYSYSVLNLNRFSNKAISTIRQRCGVVCPLILLTPILFVSSLSFLFSLNHPLSTEVFWHWRSGHLLGRATTVLFGKAISW